MKNLRDFFEESRKITDKTLDLLVPSEDVEPKRLHGAIRWSLFGGGKRFRPALVFAVGEVFNVETSKLLRTAAAIEMIHTYSLMHDDLPAMDNDNLRRGRETCHKKFDEATAILAGDVLQTLAFQAVSEDGSLSAEMRIKVIIELTKAAGTPLGMAAGQQMDLEAEKRKISGEELENIHHSKTGAMICAATRTPAIIADAGVKELEAITDYALNLGLLFQVTDDLLDVTQTTEVLGKTAGKDLTAKKATYPSLYGLEQAKKLASEIHIQAIDNLSVINNDTEILKSLADFILNRRK